MRTRLSVQAQAALSVLPCLLLLATPAAHADFAEADDAFGRAVARGDFNGDGYEDLAVGVTHEDIEGGPDPIVDAGAVEVIYGTASGLGSANRQFWFQGAAGLDNAAEANDDFGISLAAGDFNNDGYDDLAVGVPYEDVVTSKGNLPDAGVVNVIYGSATGLSTNPVPDQIWHQNSANVEGVAFGIEYFGDSLTAGDFNNDGYDDLAIGVPFDWVGSLEWAGSVNVIYGSTSGLSATAVPDQLWHQDSANMEDDAEAWDFFGRSLAAGDFNGDGYDDLAIGVSSEGVGNIDDAGAVAVIYGLAGGLSTAFPDQLWHQDVAGVDGAAEKADYFGHSLAAGDFDGDGRDDLAIGVPSEDLVTGKGNVDDAGAVNVIYGSASGLSATAVPDQVWHQDSANMEDNAEANDSFGKWLAAGDFNGDGRDDLAIGVPYEDLVTGKGNVDNAGAVAVIHGLPGGLSTAFPDQVWHQDVANVEDAAEKDDAFGVSLAAGDFNGDGRDDVAIGVPGDDINDWPFLIEDAGAVNAIYGSSTGLNATTVPDQLWTQQYCWWPPCP